jgi:hypothetical protein
MQRVVDLVLLGAQLGIDQRPSGEGQPDLVLGCILAGNWVRSARRSCLRVEGGVPAKTHDTLGMDEPRAYRQTASSRLLPPAEQEYAVFAVSLLRVVLRGS